MHNELACREVSARTNNHDPYAKAGADHSPLFLVSRVSLIGWILPKPHNCMSYQHWTLASHFCNSTNKWQLWGLPIPNRLLVPPMNILFRISHSYLTNRNVNNIKKRFFYYYYFFILSWTTFSKATLLYQRGGSIWIKVHWGDIMRIYAKHIYFCDFTTLSPRNRVLCPQCYIMLYIAALQPRLKSHAL